MSARTIKIKVNAKQKSKTKLYFKRVGVQDNHLAAALDLNKRVIESHKKDITTNKRLRDLYSNEYEVRAYWTGKRDQWIVRGDDLVIWLDEVLSPIQYNL